MPLESNYERTQVC